MSRRRTVLHTSRWAASAAVVAAMTLGAGALASSDDSGSSRTEGAYSGAMPLMAAAGEPETSADLEQSEPDESGDD